MFIKFVLIFIVASSVTSMHIPRYADLDEDDQMLYKAAYDASSYEHEEYHQDEEVPMNKLDLFKDGMWAVKAKIKEIKTFNKALAANLLATKLQLKLFLANHVKSVKKHHHVEIDKKKPVYNYQVPSQQPSSYAQYDQPLHSSAAHQYEPPQHYTMPAHNYETPQYSPPVNQYESPHPTASGQQYGSSEYGQPQYRPPQYEKPQYEPPQYEKPQYRPPQYEKPQYEPPHYGYDPYYVH